MTEQQKFSTMEEIQGALEESNKRGLPPPIPLTKEEMLADLKTMGPQGCGLEGVGGRPTDCANNPWTHPENHRPEICRQCPGNPQISRVAENPLPPLYIKLKQGV